MLGVRFLDVDFMRINFACEASDCLAYTHMGRIAIAMQEAVGGCAA
jgi:hypothetical protein